MSIWSSIAGVFGGNSRDNKGGRQSVDTLTRGQNEASGNFTNTTNGLNNLSNQLASQNYYGGAQNAYQNQVSNLAQQNQAASMLYNQATGVAPSAADLQMQQGLGQANNNAQSAAYSQQGGVSPGLTQRNLLNAQAAQNASIVGQGMVNRAGETAAGQQAYSTALGQAANTANAMYGNQYNLGNAQYQQGQNNLGYLTQTANNQQQVQSAASENIFNGYQGNLNGQTQSQQAANAALGNTIASTAGLVTGLTKKKQ